MFTWICPKCGTEVPPSSTECPQCAERNNAAPAAADSPAAPPPLESPAVDRGSAAPRAPKAPSLPAWVLAMVFAIVFLTMGTLGFLGYRYFAHKGEPLDTGPLVPARRQVPAEGATSATLNPNVLDKYIEVTGLRLLEENPKNLQVEFVIVNHSPAPLTDIAGTVTIRPITAKADGESVGTFNFRLPELRPYEAKDMKAPLQTKLRVYELPDWQFIRADVVITSPRPAL
jgi:hypothetical protein